MIFNPSQYRIELEIALALKDRGHCFWASIIALMLTLMLADRWNPPIVGHAEWQVYGY